MLSADFAHFADSKGRLYLAASILNLRNRRNLRTQVLPTLLVALNAFFITGLIIITDRTTLLKQQSADQVCLVFKKHIQSVDQVNKCRLQLSDGSKLSIRIPVESPRALCSVVGQIWASTRSQFDSS